MFRHRVNFPKVHCRIKALVLTLLLSVFTWQGSAQFASAADDPAQSPTPIKLVVFGDSLVAGFGLAPGQSYPDQLDDALEGHKPDVRIHNAGVSGDTVSAALRRLDWAIGPETDAVIIVLGGNDLLRGIDPDVTRSHYIKILEALKARKIPVMIGGMRASLNLDADYRKAFDAIYVDLAREYDAVLEPFFLKPIALKSDYNLPDGIHPNADGVARLVDHTLPEVKALLARANQPE